MSYPIPGFNGDPKVAKIFAKLAAAKEAAKDEENENN